MTTTKEVNKVELIKRKIDALGPFLPGSLSTQWNVCSTPGCRCKDKHNPQKHGPYYQLSFSVDGKSSTLFVKKKDASEVRKRIRRYKKFKELCRELVKASVEQARKQGFSEGEK